MPFSLFGNGCEIALYQRLVTRKNSDPIPKTNYFGTAKIAVCVQLFNSDANLATVRFATVAKKWVTKHKPPLEYPVCGAHEVAGKGAFTSVVYLSVIVLTASFPSEFHKGQDLSPRPSLQGKVVECYEINF